MTSESRDGTSGARRRSDNPNQRAAATGRRPSHPEEYRMGSNKLYHPIRVIGVGGGGNNAVDRMIQVGVPSADFIAVNTDIQSLRRSESEIRVQLGTRVTRGLGAGANPEVGSRAVKESQERLKEVCEGARLVFVTACLGGGTGSGAGPDVARIARESGAVVVSVVTMPFSFEGTRRRLNAEAALKRLKEETDTLVVVHNDRLLSFLDPSHGRLDVAFRVADECLRQAVEGITGLIQNPGTINLDFADIRNVLNGGGLGHFSIGYAKGEDAAHRAVKQAISSPLLDHDGIDGARGLIVNFKGSDALLLRDVAAAMDAINGVIATDANLFWGTTLEKEMEDRVEVTLMAVGLSNVVRKREARPVEKVRVAAARNKQVAAARSSSERDGAIAPRPAAQLPLSGGRGRFKVSDEVLAGYEGATFSGTNREDPYPMDDINIPAFLRRRQRQASA